MPKIVIIAEKPSLSRNIQNALKGEKNLFFTSAFGHLLTLKNVGDYIGDEKGKIMWKKIPIPFVPQDFEFKVKEDKGVKTQLSKIKTLINGATEIVCAGDADREGEVIVRLILKHLKVNPNKVKITRLWLKDQTETTIQKAFKERKELSEYNNLYREGLARTYVDWLYGINYTVELTLRSGNLMKVGRVKTALLNEIYLRTLEINNFKPEKKYRVKSNVNGLELVSKNDFSDIEKAQEYSTILNNNKTYIEEKETKTKSVARPKLFSLSKLSNLANKVLGISPKQTLEQVQELYEQGYLTYPRTDSEYMSKAEKDFAIEICKTLGEEYIVKENDYIFNDSKIKSHSAITPTTKKFTGKNKVYELVLERFKEHFYYKDTIVEETIYTIKNGENEKWEKKSETVVQTGYKKYETTTLPYFEKGETIKTNFIEEEYFTTPPQKHNVESINSISKKHEIGTEATLPVILEELVKEEYIKNENKHFVITNKGIRYIEIFKENNMKVIDKSLTEIVGKELEEIYKGEKEIPVLVDEIKNTLFSILVK